MRIKQSNAVRDAIANISTDTEKKYYNKPSEAISLIFKTLEDYNFRIAEYHQLISWNDKQPTHHQTFDIETSDGQPVDSVVVFSWYIMPSGRYEITTYLS